MEKIKGNQYFMQNYVQNNPFWISFHLCILQCFLYLCFMHNGCFYYKIIKTSLGVMTVSLHWQEIKISRSFRVREGLLEQKIITQKKLQQLFFCFLQVYNPVLLDREVWNSIIGRVSGKINWHSLPVLRELNPGLWLLFICQLYLSFIYP